MWLRRVLPFLTLALLGALIYDGSVFYGRWRDARNAANAQAAKEASDDRRVIEALGGDHLKILAFYASPPNVRSGEPSTICYGVNAAQTVRIDPPVAELHPAPSHCLQVTPRADTNYKLTVADSAGHQLTQTLTIHVAR
jgi:hypothetical protein